jgi:nitroimidazol reductase NimA-like FMN-containing flavoprotein (pyridoxamine 5'-phosphate oxidase superfamily)
MLGVLNDAEITAVLQNSMLGRIGCSNGSEIYIVPVTYIYTDNAVVFHSFEGKKLDMMRHNPEVCFEVESITDHQNWKCVIAQGTFEELTDPQLTDQVRKRLTEVSLKKKASLTALPPAEHAGSLQRSSEVSVFYRVSFHRVSGRYEQAIQVH